MNSAYMKKDSEGDYVGGGEAWQNSWRLCMWTQYYKEARVRQNMPAFSVKCYESASGRINTFLRDSKNKEAVQEHKALKSILIEPYQSAERLNAHAKSTIEDSSKILSLA